MNSFADGSKFRIENGFAVYNYKSINNSYLEKALDGVPIELLYNDGPEDDGPENTTTLIQKETVKTKEKSEQSKHFLEMCSYSKNKKIIKEKNIKIRKTRNRKKPHNHKQYKNYDIDNYDNYNNNYFDISDIDDLDIDDLDIENTCPYCGLICQFADYSDYYDYIPYAFELDYDFYMTFN